MTSDEEFKQQVRDCIIGLESDAGVMPVSWNDRAGGVIGQEQPREGSLAASVDESPKRLSQFCVGPARSGLNLFVGDARQVLRSLEAESVHTVVTSPPYLGLRDYGAPASLWGGDPNCAHEWNKRTASGEVGKGNWTQGVNGRGEEQPGGVAGKREPIRSVIENSSCRLCGAWRGCLGNEPNPPLYLEHIVEIFAEVWRVLRKDGTLFVNVGDSYSSGGNGGHLKSPGFHGHSQREGGDLKGQSKRIPGFKAKDRMGLPHRIAFALQDAGWYFRDEWVWNKPAPMPGSQRDRATVAHEFIFMFSKAPKYFYDIDAISEAVTGNANPRGNGLSPRARHNDVGNRQNSSFCAAVTELVPTRYPRSVVSFAPEPFVAELCTSCSRYYGAGAGHLPKHGEGLEARPICECGQWDAWLSHYASFPTALPEKCIRAGTSEYGACKGCGAPWVRVVAKQKIRKEPSGWDTGPGGHRNYTGKHHNAGTPQAAQSRMVANIKQGRSDGLGTHDSPFHFRHTVGWQPGRPQFRKSGNKARKVNVSGRSNHLGSSIPYDAADHLPDPNPEYAPRCACGSSEVVPCTVLDLFNGTGRTGLAAGRLGRRYIGIDVKPAYIELSRNYLEEELRKPPLIAAIEEAAAATGDSAQLELGMDWE